MEKEKIKEVLEQLHIAPSEDLLNSLSKGEQSFLLKNVVLNDEAQDGKIKFFIDKQGDMQFSFNKKEPKLDIPTQLLGQSLLPEERQRLEKGEFVTVKNISFQVDKELNKVVIKTPEFGRVREFGNYTFSQLEQDKLSSGQKVGPKVFYDQISNQYVLASIEQTKEGIKISAPKAVSSMEAQELIQKYNVSPTKNLDSDQNVVNSIANMSSDVKLEKELTVSDIEKMIDKQDYVSMDKSVLSESLKVEVQQSRSYLQLSNIEKIAINTALKIGDRNLSLEGKHFVKEGESKLDINKEIKQENENSEKKELRTKQVSISKSQGFKL